MNETEVEKETALRCAELAMAQCRALNEIAMEFNRRSLHAVAETYELKANTFEWMARIIRREFRLEGETEKGAEDGRTDAATT